METSIKIKCVEYFIDCLHSNERKNVFSFTPLKIIKLLFFTTAASIEIDPQKNLLTIFDNFVAMPYGPVESDIYNSITQNTLNKYFISIDGCKIKDPSMELNIHQEAKDLINKSIDKLKEKNNEIFNYTPVELVDISHKWSCWKNSYEIALQFNKNSYSIPSESIKKSIKYYK